MAGKRIVTWVGVIAVYLCTPTQSRAQAHFAPGVASIRDYSVPEPGLYVAVYNYGYITSTLTDNNGIKVSQVFVGPVAFDPNLDVKLYALSPVLIWVSDWKFLGANYGAYIGPSFSNANIGASLSVAQNRGINPETAQFAVGDLFVQPVWLGWNRKHFDVALGYGFYAPVGKFDTRTLTLPSGTHVFTSPTNVGLGYWTNQLQANVTWYPNPLRSTAVTNTVTVEFNGQQHDTHFTNGNYLTWNWGASQYLPLDDQFHHLFEFGLTGYSSWQISDSTGPTVTNPSFHTQVHGIGIQTGLIFVRKGMQLNFRYLHEYYAANRFRGDSYSLNLGFTLKSKPPAPPPPAAP